MLIMLITYIDYIDDIDYRLSIIWLISNQSSNHTTHSLVQQLLTIPINTNTNQHQHHLGTQSQSQSLKWYNPFHCSHPHPSHSSTVGPEKASYHHTIIPSLIDAPSPPRRSLLLHTYQGLSLSHLPPTLRTPHTFYAIRISFVFFFWRLPRLRSVVGVGIGSLPGTCYILIILLYALVTPCSRSRRI